MAYNQDLPADITAPTEIRENFRALKEDKIVAADTATTADLATTAANCTGNAATATKLESARHINGVSFDGTADITITEVDGKPIATTDKIPNAFSKVLVNGTTIQADSQNDTVELEAGTNISLNADASNEKITVAITGQVASAAQADNATIADNATKLATAHTINGVAFDGATDIIITAEAEGGKADTATKLATARMISLSGDAIGSTTFDGSADMSILVDVISADTAAVCTGNAAMATKLKTARTINGVYFDGTADITLTKVNGKNIATTDEIPTSLPAKGGDADTVDGKHATDFASAGYVPPNATEVTAGAMSAADKTKLDSIEAGAQVNQNTFSSVVVNGTTIHADSQTDTLELVEGTNIALTADAASEKVTIAVTGKVISAVQADNAATATKLATARTINGVSFDGSANIAITTANGGTIATTEQLATSTAHGKKLFTTSGIFTVPIGVTQVWVSLCGGGGNGGSCPSGAAPGGGGGGGAAKIAYGIMGLTGGSTIPVTVGGAGATSSFGAYVSCAGGGNGGDGGPGIFGTAGASGGLGGGVGSVGSYYTGSIGGGSIFGSGGNYTGTVGGNGSGYGGGGAGGMSTGPNNGGAGAPGMVLVEW